MLNSPLPPDLYTGITIEVFKSTGSLPVLNVRFMICDNGSLYSVAKCFTILGMMLSCPQLFDGSKFSSSFLISCSQISINRSFSLSRKPQIFVEMLRRDLQSSVWKRHVGAHQAPVVQRLDNAIHRLNHYPADSVVCFVNAYPLDSDLSGG